MAQNITFIRKEEIANGTEAFYFEKPEGFEFRAGQNADLTLIDPPETDDEGNKRTFSMITDPSKNELGFATRMRDTAFKHVLGGMEVGAEISLDGPYGNFTLHKTEETPAVFLIGGVGVTPVRSMIADATRRKTAHKMTLLHANKTPQDAPFTEDFKKFSAENENLTFVPVVGEAPNDWQGEKRRIDAEMVRRYVEDIQAPIYYLSGPPAMVKTMRELLVNELEVNEDNIRTEEFAGY